MSATETHSNPFCIFKTQAMNIIRQIFEIILKKRAPEDVDYNVNAAIISCALIAFGYYCLYSALKEFSQPLLYAIVLTSSHVVAYALLLKLQRKDNRLVQTLTTLMATSFILNCMAFAFLLIPIVGILAIFFWGYSIVLSVRIIKSSFSCPTFLAVVIFISVSIFSSTMLSVVAPKVTVEYQQVLDNLQRTIDEQKANQGGT